MRTVVCANKKELGEKAARSGAELIRQAIDRQGSANIVVATGTSQNEMIEALVMAEGIAWNKVTVFHLDEYINMPITHPASFRLYLWKRFVSRLPLPLATVHYVDGQAPNAAEECARLAKLITAHPIDVAFVGIGENGHLAFNDPPADFQTEQPYLLVNLDEACRRQQVGEGWFKGLQDVPTRAISMSCRQVMKSRAIVCSTPDQRKAEAVHRAMCGPITPQTPASILQRHAEATIYLDRDSASMLTPKTGWRD